MSDHTLEGPKLDVNILREAIREEYAEVAANPQKGFHFHTGRPLARILGYEDEWLVGIPESSIESFAGTGNPFSLGELRPGEKVVDVGCGAGIDSLIAAGMVAPAGQVIGVDMSPEMLQKVPTSGSAPIPLLSHSARRAPAGRKPRTSQPNWWATGSSRAIPV